MERRLLWVLVVVNVVLAATLVMRFGQENTAVAQAHRPADYVLIPGEVAGGASAVVYMVDTTNGWLGAMSYDDARQVLNTMPPIDLSRIFQTGPAPAAGNR